MIIGIGKKCDRYGADFNDGDQVRLIYAGTAIRIDGNPGELGLDDADVILSAVHSACDIESALLGKGQEAS